MGNEKLVPSCAVLLAAHNGVKWIEEQVETILNQFDVSITLFLSVDRSNDGTEEWATTVANIKGSRVVLLPLGERFGGASGNFFRLLRDVEFDSYDMVAFADQDDVWYRNKIKLAWSEITSGSCDVVSSDVIAFWSDGSERFVKKSYSQRKFDYFFEAAGPGCTYVFSQTAALYLKDFVVRNRKELVGVSLHDWLAYAVCRDAGFNWFILPQATVLYRQHANNQFGSNNGVRAFMKRLCRIRDGWYRDQVFRIYSVVTRQSPEEKLTRSFLVRNFWQLRRRLRERFFLLFIVLANLF